MTREAGPGGDAAFGRPLERIALDAEHAVFLGRLPDDLRADAAAFARLWALHPAEYHDIRIGGRAVKTPRWQQAFGRDYRYTGNVNRALPVPPALAPYVAFAQAAIDPRLNGLLVNWYDAALGHYMGPHRDVPTGLIPGSPIATISFGATRPFRLRPHGGGPRTDLELEDGAVVVMPWATNRAWTHAVPRLKAYPGRRISVTVRAFAD